VINNLRILGLLFADDFAITLLRSYRLQKQTELVDKGKAIPLQAWTGPEGSRRLRLPDLRQLACEGGYGVSPTP
jgi:hypothetical protein